MAADLTSSLSRLLTLYLQQRGFTCGVSDLLLKPAAEATRARLLAGAELDALRASADFVGHSLPPSLQSGDGSDVRSPLALPSIQVQGCIPTPLISNSHTHTHMHFHVDNKGPVLVQVDRSPVHLIDSAGCRSTGKAGAGQSCAPGRVSIMVQLSHTFIWLVGRQHDKHAGQP